jgi:hypothetical protein
MTINNTALIPFGRFKEVVRKVLSKSKSDSDKQIAEMQASNSKKREARKRR